MKKIYSGKVIKLQVESVRLPNGHQVDLEWVDHPGAAAVVPLLDPHRVVLIRQYRHATGGYLYEIPAGKLDLGEDPELCARRELLEETGYEAEEIRPLISIWMTPGFCNEKIHLFEASRLQVRKQNLEQDEVLEVKIFSWDDVLNVMESGEIQDAKSMVALQRIALERIKVEIHLRDR